MMSSKSTINHIVFLIAVLVLISSSVGAITEDFSAFGSRETIDVCACDFTTQKVSLHNTGDVTSTYMVYMSGEAASWTNIAPQTFALEGGELKTLEQFIKVPCSARGAYELNTSIRTLFDTEKVIRQAVNVQNCENVQIIPKSSDSQEVCPCTPVQYSFEVVNTGKHVEIYQISVEPFSDAISLSTDILILEPGEKQQVTVFINLECGRYGEQLFTFNAFAEGTKMLGQAEFGMDIKKCYDYSLVIDDEYEVCQGVPNVIPFKIVNNASIANTYSLFVDGDATEWVYTENSTVDVFGGETKEADIILFPPNEQESEYEITLTTLSARGQEQRSKNIKLETNMCHDYQLVQSEDALKATECKQKEHVFNLKNIGSRDTTYYVDVAGFDWLTTSSDPIFLLAGEEAQVVLSGQTPCNLSGEFKEDLYVTIKETNQTFLEEKTLTIYTKEDSYMPDIKITDLEIDYEGGETAVEILNTGFEPVSYDLFLIASDWITIDTSSVTLAAEDNATVLLQAYPANDTVEDTYMGELVLAVSGENIEYSTEFFVDLKEQRGLPLWLWAAISGIGLLLIVVIIVLIVVLTGRKKKKKLISDEPVDKDAKKDFMSIDKREYRKSAKEEKKVKIWTILVAIALLALIVGAGYYAYSTGVFDRLQNDTASNETVPDIETEDVTVPVTTVPETPEPEETATGVLTNEDIQESLITIDRSGVPGEGNTLELTNETSVNLQMSITNPTDRKAKFEVATDDDSWVEFDQSVVSVMPDATKTISVRITPDLEQLEQNDYSIKIKTTLEGKKIQYEEELDLVLTKKKPFFSRYWPWMIAGLVALVALLLIIWLSGREKTEKVPPIKKSKEEKKAAKAEKKAARKDKKEEKKSGIWLPIAIGVVVLLILAAFGFWAYNTFKDAGDDVSEEDVAAEESVEAAVETAAEPAKLTEDDVEEPLIKIDRTGIPGEGDVFKLEQDSYEIPMSIYNPTDRKARFTVNTTNESWVSFQQYIILVGPNSVKNINMTLEPDMDALKKNDYKVSINTKLEGAKIDYEETLEFVLKKKRPFELGWLWYILGALVVVGLVILIIEVVKRREKKPKSMAAAAGKKKAVKKKPVEKGKSVAAINKDLAKLRKKTVLKVKGSK
ncbi:hypothetical protein ACFL3V_01900 [Nanoarchaeota archaeon]